MHDANGPQRMRGLPHAVYTLAREQGLAEGFFGGTAATVLKGAVNNCIRFALYSELKKVFCAAGEAPDPATSLAIGGLAGGVSAVVTHPVDTIKSNLQGLTAHRYSGNLDCARQIIREKGFVNGLYLGIKPRVVRVVIENAILFSVFEVLSRRLDVEIPKWAYLGRGGSG